ncbi:MAG TPA: SDR family oxidoreductase [Actinomycetota bacterium]|nr:SDR family oxidoreductase [Actinomycetota bacterium]
MVDELPAATARTASPFRSPLAEDALAGRVAIVTGGGTGIGRATALEFARTGAAVAICGRRPEPLHDARSRLESAGADVLAMPCDVREPDEVEAFLGEVDGRFGRVDVLVNNAGGQFAAPLESTSMKGLRAVHRLNVDAPWDLTQRVAQRWMIPARRGFVAFLGFSPRRGIPSMVHSSMARSALETFAAGIALEWSRYGIRAVAVSCGLIESEGLRRYGGEEVIDAWARSVPLKRAGLAEEVASTIAFLASDGAGYITGTTVVVDGGADAWGLGDLPPDLAPPDDPEPSTS